MSYDKRPSGHDCPPLPEHPAEQPKPPGDNCPDDPPKYEIAPGLPKDPKPCPPADCKGCPTTPGKDDEECLEKLIEKQVEEVVTGKKAEAFKADLEAFLGKAKGASQEYTRDKYKKLVKQWVEQDIQIADLIRKLVCAVPCWRCIIECFVCPLLDKMHEAEWTLLGDGGIPSDLHNQYDLVYWYTRDKDRKDRRFNRIKDVLAAWEKPAQTIEKALADNAKLIADSNSALGTAASKVVFDVFSRLVPMHLAIAPPKNDKHLDWTTRIDEKFTKFCACDADTPDDDCCGPDVGPPSLRERLIGPQPYLIDPNDYFALICCLVGKRYRPAKEALGKAEAAVATAENELKRLKSRIENGLKSFNKDAKDAIPSDVDCCDFEKDDDTKSSQTH